MVLTPVAGMGATLSFQSLYEAARPIFGTLAVGFPLLADMLILGSTLAYLAGAIAGPPLPGWARVRTRRSRRDAPVERPGRRHRDRPLARHPGLVVDPGRNNRPSGHRPLENTERLAARTDSGPAVDQQPSGNPADLAADGPHRSAHPSPAPCRTGLHAAVVQTLKTAMPRRGQRGARHLIRRQLRAGCLDPITLE